MASCSTRSPLNVEEVALLATHKVNVSEYLSYESGEFLKRRILVKVTATFLTGYDTQDWVVKGNQLIIPRPPKILSGDVKTEVVEVDTWFFDGVTQEDLNAIYQQAYELATAKAIIPDDKKIIENFVKKFGYDCIFTYNILSL